MAPINSLSILAFASAALAVPHAQWQPFKRHAHAHPGAPPAYNDGSSAAPAYGGSSSAAAPAYGSSASGAWGSSSAAGALSSSAYPSGYGYSSGYAHGTGWGYGTGYSARPTGYSASSGYGSYSVCTETSTLIYRSTTEYSTYYVTHTVYESGSASVSAAPAGSYAASSAAAVGSAPAGSWGSAPGDGQGASCVPDVTVTTTERSTIYVTAGASGAAAASSYVIPDKGHSYGGGGWGASSEASAVPSGSAAAPSYGAPSGSAAAPSYGAPSGSAAAPSYSAAPSAPVGGGSSGYSGKRGLAYNDASLCDAFEGTDADAWAYNWGSSSSGLTSSIPFIPMLWGPSSEFTDSWESNAKSAIAAGAPYLFSFNEPDNPSQANLSPEAAAAAWKTYMEPFAGQAKLVAPSVTNGQAPMGVAWLKEFLSACSDCTIDAVNMHWYYAGNPIDTFKSQLTEAAGTGKPLWLTEFGATGSDDEISQFLETVMPWMDSNDSILGYSYYMVSDGLLVDGNSLSSYGQTYAGSS